MKFRIHSIPFSLLACAAMATAMQQQQQPLYSEQFELELPDHDHELQAALTKKPKGVGHFSEWSRQTKKEFLIDWQAGEESKWTIVQGNEAGDLDSMTAALTWAYHLEHLTANTSNPRRVIALLQTPSHALDLRPENQLALKRSQMTPGHEDLLTLDELPEDPETLGPKLQGIVLVDHAQPLRKWQGAEILSIFDHHADQHVAPDAEPRVFERVASCTTLVARQMLDERDQLDVPYHLPHELLELILSAIAIDSSGLTDSITTKDDMDTAKRVVKLSNWSDKKVKKVMGKLNEKLKKAKKNLGHLGLRDLLRRDWKGDLVDTLSPRTPTVSLGFASIPYSMDDQIMKTDFQELFNWFAVQAAWTAETGVDISVILSKQKVKVDGKKKKIREVTLVVRDDVRINQTQADSLFETVKRAIEASDALDLKPWHRNSELAPRQHVWIEKNASSRKVIRPIVEKAVEDWDL